MGLRDELYERMVRERIAQEVEADRHRRRVRVAVMGVCMLWTAAALIVFAYGLTSYDPNVTLLARDVGRVVGIGGIIVTLIWYKAWAERTGQE